MYHFALHDLLCRLGFAEISKTTTTTTGPSNGMPEPMFQGRHTLHCWATGNLLERDPPWQAISLLAYLIWPLMFDADTKAQPHADLQSCWTIFPAASS